MKNILKSFSVAGFVLALAATASAQTPQQPLSPLVSPDSAAATASPSASVADQLAQVQAQIPLLKAQAEVAKLKQEIANPGRSQDIGAAKAVPQVAMMGVNEGYRPAAAAPMPESRPAVVSITGYDGEISAMLKYQGRSFSVHAGSRFGKDYRVVSITAKEVVVSRGRAILTLRP